MTPFGIKTVLQRNLLCFYLLKTKKKMLDETLVSIKQLLKYQGTVRWCIINVTSLKSSLRINNTEKLKTAVVLVDERRSDKNMLSWSLHGPGLCVCFCPSVSTPWLFGGSCECWVTLRSFRCALGSSFDCLCKWTLCFAKSLPSLPLFSSTVSFNFQTKYREGSTGE